MFGNNNNGNSCLWILILLLILCLVFSGNRDSGVLGESTGCGCGA
jgi:hypothetical protein